MSLAKQTLSGFIWTLTSRVGTRASIFIVGIILARLLTPEDFGLIAMLAIFFSISSSLVESGFTHALIRESEISEDDKTTVFYINVVTSVLLYILLWFSSPSIASFFNQPELVWLTRVMALDILFRSLIIVQRAVLTQSLKFKLLSSINISISVATGVIAIFFAYNGFGVWALAIKYFLSSLLTAIIIFVVNPWFPKGKFNKDSFNRLFGFGSKLMITGIFNITFYNIYNIVIGKLFSPAILGFYNMSFNLSRQPVTTVLIALQQVTYPILSKTKDNLNHLKLSHQRILKLFTFINTPLILILAFTAEPLVKTMLGEKWINSVPFLQLLCISAFALHINALSKDILKILGKGNLYMKISIFSKFVTIIAIVIGYQFGIWGLIVGSIIAEIIEAVVSMSFIANHIKYSFKHQIKDILRIILLSVPLATMLYFLNTMNFNNDVIKLLTMGFVGLITYLSTTFLSNSDELNEVLKVLKVKSKK